MAVVVLNAENIDIYKQRYPSLINVLFDHSQNNFAINNILLGTNTITIDERLLMMSQEDINEYLIRGFYKKSNDNDYMSSLFNRIIITEADNEFIQKYVENFNSRIKIYLKYKNSFDQYMSSENIGTFLRDTLTSKKIIEEARLSAQKGGQDAASLLIDYLETPRILPQDTNNNNENEQAQAKEMTLSRSKPSQFKGLGFDEEEYIRELNHLDAAGFTSILAVIAVTLVLGIFLAITLLK